MKDAAKTPLYQDIRVIIALTLVPGVFIYNAMIWDWHSPIWLVPNTNEFFEAFLHIFGQYRLVLPSFLLQPVLALASYVMPISLALAALLLSYSIPLRGYLRILALLLCLVVAYPFALPGQFSPLLLKLLFSLFLILPLTRSKPSPYLVWSVATLSLLVSLVFQVQIISLLWMGFSVGLTFLMKIFFSDRGKLSVAEKRNIIEVTLNGLGLFILVLMVIFGLTRVKWDPSWFEISRYFWLGPITAGLAVFHSYKDPWHSTRWLCIATFSLGPLVSHQLLVPVVFLLSWQILYSASKIVENKLKKLENKLISNAMGWGILGLFFVVCVWRAETEPHTQRLEREWAVVVQSLSAESSNQGLALLGDALPLIGLFYKGDIIENAPLELIQDEKSFLNWMENTEVSKIFIDRNYIKEKWKKHIESGMDPKLINSSVLSRLIVYRGDTVETETMRLPEIRSLRLQEDTYSKIVWIEKKNALN